MIYIMAIIAAACVVLTGLVIYLLSELRSRRNEFAGEAKFTVPDDEELKTC